MAQKNGKYEEKYLPCIMTRLADDDPQSKIDNLSRVVSLEKIKLEILDNISQILNSRSRPRDADLNYNNELTHSVLGYGLNDFCGKSLTNENIKEILQQVKNQLIYFEPRLLAESIEVRHLSNEPTQSKCTFALEVKAKFAVKELPEDFLCISYLDLESGLAITKEGS